jgi:acyl-CoA thioesterase II
MNEYDLVLDSFYFDRLDDNLFQSRSPQVGWHRIYGGLLLAHAVQAAQLTVTDGKVFHSLHGSFLRPGDMSASMVLDVGQLLNGRSVANRQVTIRQNDKPVFTANLSFRGTSGGLTYAPGMPDAAAPETLPDEATILARYQDTLPGNAVKYLHREKVFELRPVNARRFILADTVDDSPLLLWVRLRAPTPPGPELNAVLLSYLSDMAVLNASLVPHGRNFFDPALTLASLDHALWQHAPADFSNWMLVTHDCLSSEAQMGLGHTRIYNRDGSLCATVSQQGMTRLGID